MLQNHGICISKIDQTTCFEKIHLKHSKHTKLQNFFLGDEYTDAKAEFKNKKGNAVFLNHQSDDISGRLFKLYLNNDNVYEWAKIKQWLQLSYSEYGKKYIKEGGEDDMFYILVGDPRSVQNLIFYIIHSEYAIQSKMQYFKQDRDKTWKYKDIDIRKTYIFSCVGCGVDFVYGKCEHCAQNYCSDACHTNDHKNGCKTKIK